MALSINIVRSAGTRQPRILSFVRSAESGFRGVVREIEELRLGLLETAYIDGNVASNLMYKPQFVSNNYKEGKKVHRKL